MYVKVRSTTQSVGRIVDDVDGMLETAVRNKTDRYTSVPTLDRGRAVRSVRWIGHGCANVTVDRDTGIC